MTYRVIKDALGWSVRRKDGAFIARGQCESTAEHICKELNDWVHKQSNTQAILDDFMEICNQIQRFEDNEIMRERYINVARDMLQNMGVKLK